MNKNTGTSLPPETPDANNDLDFYLGDFVEEEVSTFPCAVCRGQATRVKKLGNEHFPFCNNPNCEEEFTKALSN